MLACANKECSNYKQELEAGVELCPLCGSKPEQFKAKNNQTLAVIAAIAAFAGLVIMWSSNIVVGLVIGGLGAAASFFSKSILSIIISCLLFLASIGIFILFIKPF